MIASPSITLRVSAIEPLSGTLKRLTLQAAEGGLLPVAAAGAHLALALSNARRAFRNAYSVISGPEERSFYTVIVRRTHASRGGSAFIHDQLREGTVLAAIAPTNFFPLQLKARKHLLIGGGIGITPLLSYLPTLRASRQALELHQLARPDEARLFEQLLAPFASHAVAVHAGRGSLDIAAVLARQPLGTHVYCCGLQSLLDFVEGRALQLGWPASSVHREDFGAAGGEPFVVRLGISQRDIAVGAHESMLEALEAAGVPAPSLCRGGACGQCLTGVLGGIPDHRDHFLEAVEQAAGQLVMPCVSRSKSPILVLAL